MRPALLLLSLAAGIAAAGGAAAAEGAPGASPVVFPLTVSPGQRYLADAANRPFLIHGDTAWSMIAGLRREEVDRYLDDRRARGFNTLLASLLEHRFTSDPPANAYGQRPFLVAGDYGTPNEGYFAHADWVLERAAEAGFLVLLTPSYLGAGGGADGWYQEMVANGPGKLRAYGRFLGRRYRDRPNILWMHGGDYDPPEQGLVRAIATGIRDEDGRALQSVHGGPGTPALRLWRGEPWLKVNTVYSYGDIRAASLEQWRDPEAMPFFLIESFYENEHGVTERQLRTQAYHAVLSGAAGQVFGNNPIWHFDGPGIFPAPVGWQEALDSRGAQSMTHLGELLRPLRWWTLRPDPDGAFLGDAVGPSEGSEDDRPVAAVAGNGAFAVAYLPTRRAVSVDLAQLVGPRLRLRWYDPAEGRFVGPGTAAAPPDGRRTLRPPRANAAGFGDWVLLAESGP